MANKTVAYGDQNMMVRHLMMDAPTPESNHTRRFLVFHNVNEALYEDPLPIEYRDRDNPGIFFAWYLES